MAAGSAYPRLVVRRACCAFVLLLLLLAGCDTPGPARTTPSDDLASPDESVEVYAWPSGAIDPKLCESIKALTGEYQDLRAVRLLIKNRGELQRQFDDVAVLFGETARITPDGLARSLNNLSDAVGILRLAVEDYRTTDRPGDAADHIHAAQTTFERALRTFRRASGCVG